MMKKHDLSVKYVSIYSVEQHPENANNGDVDTIAQSMEVSGVYSPIFVQTSTRFIIAGNHRYAAMAKLGMTEIPIIELDVTNIEAKRMMLVDNRTTRLGYNDEAQEADLLQAIYQTDEGLKGTGYDFADLTNLLELIESPLSPDDFPVEDVNEPSAEEIRRDLKRHLRFVFSPVISEDGNVFDLGISKSNFRKITAHDFNMLRKAIGLDPLSQEELDTFNVPDWKDH